MARCVAAGLLLSWAVLLSMMLVSDPLPPRPEPLLFEPWQKSVLLVWLGAHLAAACGLLRGEA